ncbi:DNA repair protein RecO [Candidatus Berkelbacteria bacterium]|nr:DNA repair protein RecO [Candidatus Berkelbacteria bacterium]
MTILKTRGVVLKRRVYGEADRILTILTPRLGKITAIAKGSRRPTSKLVGHLELFYLVDWVLAEGRTWYIVSSAETVVSFQNLQKELSITSAAGYIATLIDRVLPEGETSSRLYHLAIETFTTLTRAHAELILRQTEWQILLAIGLRPELHRCSHCAQALTPTHLGLCPTRGGALCVNCLMSEAIHIPVTATTLKLLRLFEQAPKMLARRLVVPKAITQELERVTRAFLEHALEKPIPFQGLIAHANN